MSRSESPMKMRHALGVCVLTYNSAWRIRDCFSSLSTILAGMDAAVVCVDNASRDESADIVEKEFPWVKLIRSPKNGGYSAGNNLGAGELLERGCEFLAFLNPDVRLRPDTLLEMRSVLQQDGSAGCVGAQGLRGPERAFRRRPTWMDLALLYGTARFLPLLRTLLAPFCRLRARRHYLPPSRVNPGQQVYAVAGDCIMFRAKAFEAAGGFDERTFMYAEEFIMSERLSSAGYRIVVAPQARYTSDPGGSSSGVVGAFLRRVGAESLVTYARLYRGWAVRASMLEVLYGCEDACWSLIDRLRTKRSAG